MEMLGAIDSRTWLMFAVAVAVILAASGIWLYIRTRQSEKLHERFGPEYDRTVSKFGSRSKGESELKAREKRVERLDIVPLEPKEAARFGEAWGLLQNRRAWISPRRAVRPSRSCCWAMFTRRSSTRIAARPPHGTRRSGNSVRWRTRRRPAI